MLPDLWEKCVDSGGEYVEDMCKFLKRPSGCFQNFGENVLTLEGSVWQLCIFLNVPVIFVCVKKGGKKYVFRKANSCVGTVFFINVFECLLNGSAT
jgi:hypothetical protein